MPRSAPVDGFRLAYDRAGSGPPVVLLHGWPGDRADFRAVMPLFVDAADVVVTRPARLRRLGQARRPRRGRAPSVGSVGLRPMDSTLGASLEVARRGTGGA
jgi:pimeloyl-ACP methyl ester carboxylesterase